MVDHVIYNLGRQIGTLGLSDLEKAVVKATYFDENPPKEKWVAELVSQTQSFMGEAKKSSSDILDCLVRRMRSDHWQVILKAMIVIHRLLREGGYAFSEAISQMDADSLSVQNSLDAYTTMTSTQSRLVRNYEKYLLKKLDVYREIGFSLEKKFNSDGVEWVKNLSDKTLIEFAKKVQIQLDFLLDCNVRVNPFYHQIFLKLTFWIM